MKPRGQETVLLLLLLLLVLPPPLFLPLLPSHRPWKRWPRQQLINYSPTWQYVGRKQPPPPPHPPRLLGPFPGAADHCEMVATNHWGARSNGGSRASSSRGTFHSNPIET